MTHPPPGTTIKQLAAQLRRSGWFTDAELRILDERWRREAGDMADARRFTHWLVARQYLTRRQLRELLDGLVQPSTALPAPDIDAILVAPAANPRPERGSVPTAVPAAPVAPPAAPIEIELVPLHPAPPAPADSADISVELVPIEERPALPSAPRSAVTPNLWLYLLLGAAGLLLAQATGWVVGYLIAAFLS